MSEFKVGDKVVLRPETKPYCYKNHKGGQSIIHESISEIITTCEVEGIDEDGSICISMPNRSGTCYISRYHLKHAPQDFMELDTNIEPCDNEELRFMIYHSNPSRTLEEMQDIEKWLLNK